MGTVADFNSDILNFKAPIVFFPVRHHSPAAARFLKECIDIIQPTTILIEGPSDFNDRLGELNLPHQLPIAIYSYLQGVEAEQQEAERRGAFYPFCLYSPEWQALSTAFEQKIPVQFIDRPWSDLAFEGWGSHRYGDGSLAHNAYVNLVCKKLGVEDFDGLWDTLFEIDSNLSLTDYFERCHHLCFHLRTQGEIALERDRFREAFMVQQIRIIYSNLAVKKSRIKILVVTGGFHSYALFAQWTQIPFETVYSRDEVTEKNDRSVKILQQGIALTPYAYDRLDSLTGYDAGMKNPGFYHQVWLDRSARFQASKGAEKEAKTGIAEHQEPSYRKLLAQVVLNLRNQKQQGLSAADLIAVESVAQTLANFRGHREVWREDLIDGILGALVKEEVSQGINHPLLEAVYQVFRGSDRGKLAPGTPLPPLVIEIQTQLEQLNLKPGLAVGCVNLDLRQSLDLEKSQFLYQLRGLKISGYRRLGGTDFVLREDLSDLWEQWDIRWSPEFEANCIEAAIYGSNVSEAVTNRLLERAQGIDRSADQAALVLLEACLMGLSDLGETLAHQLQTIIRQDSNFLQISRALGHLLYIYRYDSVLGHIRSETTAILLVEMFKRSLWLLETLGGIADNLEAYLEGLKTILEVFDRCPALFAEYRSELLQILERMSHDREQQASLRGSAIGARWHLGAMETEQILRVLQSFSNPEQLGDFLRGLFNLAREIMQRYPNLTQTIDRLIMGYSDQQFLEALPALRLAFSGFLPREKYHIATGLFPPDLSESDRFSPLDLSLDSEVATAAFALEMRVKKQLTYYGLDGLDTMV